MENSVKEVSLAMVTAPNSDDNEDDLSLSVTSERASTHHEGSSANDVYRNRDKEAQMKIAQNEERSVKTIRAVTFIAILLCAIGVSVAVYYFATASDHYNFELEYYGYVKDIQALVVWEVKYNMALLQQLSGTMTSSALMSNQNAPNITHPHFEITGGFVDGMGGIMMALYAPLIQASKREAWEEYSVLNQGWLNESARLRDVSPQHRDPLHGTIQDHEHDRRRNLQESTEPDIPSQIWKWEGDDQVVVVPSYENQLMAPLWQSSPRHSGAVNVDLLSDSRIAKLYSSMMETNQTVISPGIEIGNLFDWMFDPEEKFRKVEPHGLILERVYSNFTEEPETIGFLLALTSYRNLFTRLLPEGKNGIYAVVTGSEACEANSTYLLEGPNATFLGYDDFHELGLQDYKEGIPLELYANVTDNLCFHELNLYPSSAFQASYQTNKPAIYTSIVVLAFAITTILFLFYERMVTRRENTKNAALKAISEMFPSAMQDKVLKGYDVNHHGSLKQNNLIASFFPATTVMFADISGFTAWASTREPVQVFQLLETIYGAFDDIARHRGVFKVETVGDCYVAVVGMPDPRPDHAVAMVRFAKECQLRMASLSQQLEISLGPDTADLAFRIGIHSGPVTGGVLRGQNARFQLFGDTMNLAARLESTGIKNRIQVSSTTASLLIQAGKGKWLEKRKDRVDIKGKGMMETYFVRATSTDASTSGKSGSQETFVRVAVPASWTTSTSEGEASGLVCLSGKTSRLVDWNTEVLSRRIIAIIQYRESLVDPDVQTVEIDPIVTAQLQKYVSFVAASYRENHFHNYEHASHVTLAMEKMLSRVESASGGTRVDFTNDITSDPLVQFAVVFAALIHDVDHPGVSNAQLVQEQNELAVLYHGKSPAENHSLNLAWDALMGEEYQDLLMCICGGDKGTTPNRGTKGIKGESARLRQLIENAVMATDVFDPELKQERNDRWGRVFKGHGDDGAIHEQSYHGTKLDVDHLKATIVLEHLIQASDVAHTMQHWHVYLKWNERLFAEMTDAYHSGRLGKNPAEFWYQGELGFLDHYIIPLAMKLKECGVFGVSSDEFLDYATANRHEWEMKGEAVVAGYVRRHNKGKGTVSCNIPNIRVSGSNSSNQPQKDVNELLSAALEVVGEEQG